MKWNETTLLFLWRMKILPSGQISINHLSAFEHGVYYAGLMYYDPEFFAYLKINQADDLLFCYRWLLLEMKREFAFEDSLQVLETLWASLPPSYADKQGLPLYEVKLTEDPCQDTVSSKTAVYFGT